MQFVRWGLHLISATSFMASKSSRLAFGTRDGFRFIKPAPVLQFQLAIETEKVRGADRIIGTGDFLGCIMQIGKSEAVLPGEDFHVVKIIGGIGHRIIRADGDGGDAKALKLGGIAHQSANHGLHIGAMVADEGDERAIGAAKALQRMNSCRQRRAD